MLQDATSNKFLCVSCQDFENHLHKLLFWLDVGFEWSSGCSISYSCCQLITLLVVRWVKSFCWFLQEFKLMSVDIVHSAFDWKGLFSGQATLSPGFKLMTPKFAAPVDYHSCHSFTCTSRLGMGQSKIKDGLSIDVVGGLGHCTAALPDVLQELQLEDTCVCLPLVVDGLPPVTAVAGGDVHSLALDHTGGKLWAWSSC